MMLTDYFFHFVCVDWCNFSLSWETLFIITQKSYKNISKCSKLLILDCVLESMWILSTFLFPNLSTEIINQRKKKPRNLLNILYPNLKIYYFQQIPYIEKKLCVSNWTIQDLGKPLNTLELGTLVNLGKVEILDKWTHKYDIDKSYAIDILLVYIIQVF